MVNLAPSPVDVLDFQFKLQCKLKIFENEKPELFSSLCNIVASSSRFSLVFVGTDRNTLEVITLETVERCTLENGEVSDYSRRTVTLPSKAKHLSINCDETYLTIIVEKDNCPSAIVYDVQSFYKTALHVVQEIRLSPTPGVAIISVAWNPSISTMFTVCKSDGSLGLYDLKDSKFEITELPNAANATCICWSPKGKQIAVGDRSGKIIQYKPDLKPTKIINPPGLTDSPAIIALQWISNYQFIGVYKVINDPDSTASLIVVDSPKVGETVYTNFDDVCYSYGSNRPPQFYMHTLSAWNVLMVASSNSMELGVLGATNDTWTQWILNDNARAELPLSASKNDTLPVGMALNFGTSKSLLIGENDMPPFPLLLLLSNYGILCCFYVVNLKPDIPNMHIPPENIPDKSGINLFIKPVSIKPPSAIQPSIMLSNQVVASTQVTTPVAITKPVASLVGVVSKPITTSLTSTVSKPVTTSLFVTPTKPLFPAKDVTVNNVNVTKTVEATHQSKTKEEIDKIFALKIREECINLEASVKSLLHKSKTIHTNIGSEEEATKMANNTNELFTFLKEVTDTYKIQASEVHCLKQSLIQTWAWYEDAHSRFSVRKDSAMQAVIKLQPLDPASVKQLADIKHLLYYIESQLHQVNGALDEQWNNFQDSCKKTIKFKLPATETIYQSMVRQNAIIQKQSYVLKDIATRLKLSQNCKLGPALLVSLNKNDNLEDQLQKLEIEPKDALQMYYEKILERQLKLTSSKSTILKKLIKSRDINHVAVNKPKFVNAEQTLSFLSETISPIIAKKKEIVQSTPLIQENTTKAALPKILFSQKSEAVEITSSTKPEDTTTLKFDVPSAFVPTLSQQTSTPFAAKNTAQTLFLPQTTTPKTTVIFGAPTSTFTFTITSTCNQDEVPKQTASTVTSAFKPQVVTAVSSASAPVFNLMKEVSKSAETKGVSSFTFVFTTTQSATTTTAFTFFSSPKPIPTTSALTSTNSIEKTKNALTIFTPPTSLAATEGSSVSSIFTTTTQPTGSIFNIPAISSTQSSSSFALPSTSLKSLFTSVSTTASSAFQSPTLESIGNKSTFGGGFAITPVTTTITESSSVVASSSNDSTLFSSVSKPSSTFENSTSMFGRVQISVTGSSSPSTTSTPFTMTPSLFTVASTASSPFGATTTNSSSIFGVGSTTNNFGTTTTTSSPFGMVVTTSGSIFGATVSSTPLSFTTTGSANSTSFGKAISTTSSVPFGTVVNTSSPFGASVSTTSTDFEKITSSTSSTFGSPVNNTPAFGTIASTSSSIFGISTTTATSPFTAAVNTTSPFGATATITAVSFGAAPTTTIATFGAVATTTIAPFGAAGNTTTSPFGVTASTTAAPFGGTVTTTATPFGVSSNTSTSPFGVITSTTPAPFGVVANTTATPFGSSSNTTTSPFGGNTFGTTPVSSAAVPFGSSGNFGSSAFGTNASSPFGASSKSVFGASATIASPFSTSTSTTASPFATNNTSNAFSKSFSFSVAAANIPSTSTFSFGKSPFGFGNTSSSDGGLSFGSLNVSTTAGTGFGTGFGQTQNQQQNPFDKISPSEQKSPFSGGSIFATPATSASTGSIFGNTNTSPFNKTPAFGSSAFGTQTFGQQSAFGQQSTFGSGNAFASQQTGPFSGGTQTVSQAGFGSPQSSFGKSASAFGASPTFGGAPAFGSTPAFGGAPSFGSSPTFGGMNKVFPSSPTDAFGNISQQPQQNSTFANLANQSTLGFGSLAQQTPQANPQQSDFGGGSFSTWR